MHSHSAFSVSVIIPTFNRAGLLRETLASVCAQTAAPFEILVIDDGSTDETAAMLAREFPPVTVHRIAHAGQGAARNVGIAHARGDALAFLDSDDVWDARFVERMRAALDASPRAGFAYCDYALFDGARTLRENNVLPEHQLRGDVFPKLLETNFLCTGALLLEHLPALFHFTKWIAVAAIASTIFLKLDVLLLGYFRPPAEVGLYAVALALVGRLDVLKNAVLTTAFPDATRRTGVAELRAFIRQSLRVTGLASLAVAPLFFLSSALIVWIYGTAYAPAQNAFVPLLLAFLCGLNAEPLSYVLYALNRPHWIARMDLFLLAFNLGLNVMLIPIGGIAGAAFGVLLTRLVGAMLTLLMVKRAVARIA